MTVPAAVPAALPSTATTASRNRWILLLLIAVFVLPIALATAIFYLAPPVPTAHHGELLSPPLDLRGLALADGQGQSRSLTAFPTDWRLAYASGVCPDAAACEATAAAVLRLHVALGKDAHRVTPLWLTPTLPTDGATDGQFRSALASGIYLIDSQGFAALRYPVDADLQGVLKDLRRLLKYAKG